MFTTQRQFKKLDIQKILLQTYDQSQIIFLAFNKGGWLV
jgi:hypothetical protein